MSQTLEKYFVPEPSTYPLIGATALLLMGSGAAFWVNHIDAGPWMVAAGFAILIYMLFGWFGTVARESEGGKYGKQVDSGFRWSMGWFIFSEVMFFAAFFGSLFYVRHIAINSLGSEINHYFWPAFKAAWPSAGPLGQLEMVMTPSVSAGKAMLGLALMVAAGAAVTLAHKPLEHGKRGQLQVVLVLTLVLVGLFLGVMTTNWLPAINTALLLASAATLTWAHWSIRNGNRAQFNIFLAITIALGVVFLGCQATEYTHAYHEGLKLSTGIYGSTFFMMTGFHGLHVTIGVIMLTVMLFRSLAGHFSPERHFGFEAAAWYWHFVDYVWLLLFIVVYVL